MLFEAAFRKTDVLEDRILTAVHEVGHLFGAYHDVGYMRSSMPGGQTDKSTFYFSPEITAPSFIGRHRWRICAARVHSIGPFEVTFVPSMHKIDFSREGRHLPSGN
ncbi:MAG: hypothetical protein H6707_04190 [Deltaproteobacteria bacterium]|nr:hypothetical protein [Deltaproteobacteria bacterium]